MTNRLAVGLSIGTAGAVALCMLATLLVCSPVVQAQTVDTMETEFTTTPDSARPWVYWFFMDGNLTREGITADLEAMKAAGIGGAIYMEVGVGIEPGPVEFMSPQWQELLGHAFAEADRLGIQVAMAAGPGWCGTGGPWVKPEQSMQHIVASDTRVAGPMKFDKALPQPKPRTPFFGEGTLTPELHKIWKNHYRDVKVLAFPTPAGDARIADPDEKALYHRAPYSSQPGVKPYLPAPADHEALPPEQCIVSETIIDLTDKLAPDGRLAWDVPEGNWTIMRFGSTITGQTSRPAPDPGLGLESDKFDAAAIDAHFEAFIETLLNKTGDPKRPGQGLTTLHFDSWEMSSQNWSGNFASEFAKRRGYDMMRFLPAMLGRVVDSNEVTERFLWDFRQTAQELVVENHVLRLKELARGHGLQLSIEPYDLNPCSDLTLGSAADVPMCEFWSKGFGFSTEYSCIEATSIAHTMGRPIIGAEAFTAAPGEDWRQYPASMKAQGDWALCAGINRFVFHRYQAQPWLDRFPGMTMGPYGVHWERTQTWWDMADAYHCYISRCQQMLRRGSFVADVLYLAPEGAPHVFRPPSSALEGALPDRRGYNFDGCAPEILMEHASVEDGRIVFPDGMSYRLLVLPRFDTMTPRLLQKVAALVKDGATVLGAPPRKSPSLAGYPQCDQQVQEMAAALWDGKAPGIIRDDAAAPQQAEANPLEQARWIWFSEGNPAVSAPPGKRYFSRGFEIEDGKAIQSARAVMTADNSFELFVNGQSAGTGNNFNVAITMDVLALLKPGNNTITVVAGNGDDKANPAGLIGALAIQFRDGTAAVIHSDAQWNSAQQEDGPWTPAMDLGPSGMAPWQLKGVPAWQRDIYPSYEATAQVLAKLGVPPDFESGGNLRYIHRREGDTDLYFIANRDAKPQTATCRFRVAGRQPEWWNPMNGTRRALPEFTEQDGITTIPVRLDALESGFVVFRKPAAKETQPGRNFPELNAALVLTAPWDVSFDPKWGGPEKVVFTALEDWSKRPEPGIKYYSGKAVYRTTFDCPADVAKTAGVLALGAVKNMAAVKLNGKDLGTAWCEPWRLDIPAGTLLEKDNHLEITVANLWINRLIGDSALPKNKRLTWSTLEPFQPDSPLQESGLLGPVALCVISAGPGAGMMPEANKVDYPDGRPAAELRLNALDQGVVLKHGDGPGQCDYLGARDIWVYEADGAYYMHYDGAGPKGWLACLATSKDLIHWEKKGPVLDFGRPGDDDSASASYGVTYFDGAAWHLFYLGTPHTSPAPDLIPAFPYLTMKANGASPSGPWTKQPGVVPFRCTPNTYYDVTASPGHIVEQDGEYLMFFSAAAQDKKGTHRTISIARTKDLNGPWQIAPQPIVSPAEQIENSSIYFEPANNTWFLFTNHIGLDGGEYTDAVWVYWTNDINAWDARNKAVVLDGANCTWSRKCIGLPSVVKTGGRLAILYDAPGGDSTSHMKRDVGLAWLQLPLIPPAK